MARLDLTHITYALMEPGKWWHFLLRLEYKEQRGHVRPPKRRNYLRSSSELYKTKEALHDRL